MQQNIGSVLRYLREEHDKKQTDVSNYLSISSQAYSNYERGHRAPDITILMRLAHYYQVDLNWLLSFLVPQELADSLFTTDTNTDSTKTSSILDLNLTLDEFKLLTKFRELNSTDQSDILLFTSIKAKHQSLEEQQEEDNTEE